MRFSYFLLIMLMISCFVLITPCQCQKPFQLVLFSNDLQRIGPVVLENCRHSKSMTLEWINNQTDILPRYEIKLLSKDEAYYGINAARNLLGFKRQFANSSLNEQENSFPSPISVGPLMVQGCKAIGTFLHHIDQITLPTACGSINYQDRARFPNLFLADGNIVTKVYGMVQFFHQQGWNKLAMLTNPFSTAEFDFALQFYNVAYDQGMDILMFDSTQDFPVERAIKLKNTNARIIAIWATGNLSPIICQLWHQGIKGPRYQFITFEFNQNNLLATAESCTQEIINEQYQLVITIPFFIVPEPRQLTAFGDNSTVGQFDGMLLQYITRNGWKIGGDYGLRYACSDTVMHAALVLNATETELNSMNLSLRDYVDQPEIVLPIVREQLFKVKFQSIRYGQFFFEARFLFILMISNFFYIKTRKQESKGSSSTSYFIATGGTNQTTTTRVRVDLFPNASSAFDYDSYQLVKLSNIPWMTKDGKAPKDFWTVVRVDLKLDTSIAIVIKCVSILKIISVSIISIGVFSKRKLMRKPQLVPELVIVTLASCVLMDISAFLFTVDANNNSIVTEAQLLTGVFGLTLSTSVISLTILLANGIRVRERKKMFQNLTASQVQCQWQPRLLKMSRNSLRLVSLYMVIIVIVAICWFQIDPLECSEHRQSSKYNEKDDIFTEYFSSVCQSRHQFIWLISFAILSIVPCSIALPVAYTMKKSPIATTHWPLFKHFSLALLNLFTLIIVAGVSIAIVANPMSQQLIAAGSILIISLILSAIWLSAVLTTNAEWQPELNPSQFGSSSYLQTSGKYNNNNNTR